MPLSTTAMDGLRAAVRSNPIGGLFLLDVLKQMPEAVKHKDGDTYGPIHGVLAESLDQRSLPEEVLPLFTVFGDEWRQRCFTKRELTEAMERVLKDLGIIMWRTGSARWWRRQPGRSSWHCL